MNNDYTDLIEKIREKCRQQRWYGSDMDSPASIQELSRSDPNGHYAWSDHRGTFHWIYPDTDLSRLPIPQKFAYPPATEEQLRETERLLRFRLHPCLRAIYTQVANGGFGPGYGINGILGGFTGGLGSMVERHVNDRTRGKSKKESRSVNPEATLLELCHWGCATYSYFNNRTGRVSSPVSSGRSSGDFSLEEWLESWIADTLV